MHRPGSQAPIAFACHAERSRGDLSGRFDFVALDVGVLHRESPSDRPNLAPASIVGSQSASVPLGETDGSALSKTRKRALRVMLRPSREITVTCRSTYLLVRLASREHVIDSNVVSLELARPVDAEELSELLEHYVGELSALFAIEADGDGRFRYDKLPLYWTQPDRRFAFFIRSGKDRVGVALATRESATNDAPEHLDVAEFFVLPAHRGRGVGRQAASLLWDRLPGQWVVRVSQANVAALPFWRNTVRSYTGGAFSVSERPGQLGRWHVFSFRSAGARAV